MWFHDAWVLPWVPKNLKKPHFGLPFIITEIGDHHAGRYTKIGRGGRVYAMGSGIYAVERLEGACGA